MNYYNFKLKLGGLRLVVELGLWFTSILCLKWAFTMDNNVESRFVEWMHNKSESIALRHKVNLITQYTNVHRLIDISLGFVFKRHNVAVFEVVDVRGRILKYINCHSRLILGKCGRPRKGTPAGYAIRLRLAVEPHHCQQNNSLTIAAISTMPSPCVYGPWGPACLPRDLNIQLRYHDRHGSS